MSRDDTSYLVFATDARARAVPPLPDEYTLGIWTPTMSRVIPPGRMSPHLLVWWFAHHGRLFRNRDYRVLTIHHGSAVVHRSIAFPPYFAFPFMAANDVQIGSVWTDPAHRGRGLATIAVAQLVDALHAPGRRTWYITTAANLASISTARSIGLAEVARARRSSPMWVRALGRYRLTAELDARGCPDAHSQ